MSRKFGASLAAKSGKVNNHPAAMKAKVEMRDRVLDVIGADKAAVFDAFAGEGRLYDAVWNRAGRYVGCDLVWYRDHRMAYVCDNRRVMRAIDLAPFNVFDFDAYGSPWEHVWILAARRAIAPGERIGLCLTEGSSLKLKMGGLPHALARLSGLNPNLSGAARETDEIMERALAGTAKLLRTSIVHRWEAHGRTGAAMRYYGLVLEGKAAPEPGSPET